MLFSLPFLGGFSRHCSQPVFSTLQGRDLPLLVSIFFLSPFMVCCQSERDVAIPGGCDLWNFSLRPQYLLVFGFCNECPQCSSSWRGKFKAVLLQNGFLLNIKPHVFFTSISVLQVFHTSPLQGPFRFTKRGPTSLEKRWLKRHRTVKRRWAGGKLLLLWARLSQARGKGSVGWSQGEVGPGGTGEERLPEPVLHWPNKQPK